MSESVEGLQAEVRRLRRELSAAFAVLSHDEGEIAEALALGDEALQQAADLQARIEALADEYDDPRRPRGVHRFAVADRLRAALAEGP